MKHSIALILILSILLQCFTVCFAEDAETLPEPTEQGENATEDTALSLAAEAPQMTLTAAPAPEPGNDRGLLKVDVGEDGSLSCYVAEIPEAEADAVAAQIQSSFPDGELENPVLIDAEKRTLVPDPPGEEDPQSDSAMCWAGAISNTLWATGWGENMTNPLTGEAFTSEDDLMKYFVQSFYDGCNRMEDGIGWLLDGITFTENAPGPGWAHLRRVGSEADALAPEYCAQKLVTVTEVSYDDGSISMLDSLLNGVPVNVSAEFCGSSDSGDTHALTAMGIIVDPAAEGTDGYYRYIMLANSDNSVDGYEGTEPDTRPNIFNWYPLKVRTVSSGEKIWEIDGYCSDPYVSYTRLLSVTSIAPYGSEEAEAAVETDPQATMNALNTQDLVIEDIFTSLEKGKSAEVKTEFEHGSSVWLNFTTADASYVNCEESYKALVTLRRESDGETVSFYADCNPENLIYRLSTITESVKLNDHMTLSSGNYSVCVELNPESAGNRLTEAYYLNNLSLTQFFTILASKRVPADPGYYRRILTADNHGTFILGSSGFGIAVDSAASGFERLEVLKNSIAEAWETVTPENYSISEDGVDSFRLTFIDGYLDTLGEGTHRFRFTLGGNEHCCDIVCISE